MNIALITKNKKQINLKLLDEQLKELIEEEFQDVYTLNFFLQTIPKKYNTIKTLIVYNDLDKLNYNTDGIDNNKHKDNTLKLILAEEENSYFINEFD